MNDVYVFQEALSDGEDESPALRFKEKCRLARELEAERKEVRSLLETGRKRQNLLDFQQWQALHGHKEEVARKRRQHAVLKGWFEIIDIDHSGEIGLDELLDPLISVGSAQSRSDVSRIIASLDRTGSGEISFNEWYDLMSGKTQGTGQSVVRFFEDFSNGKLGDVTLPFHMLLATFRRRMMLKAHMDKNPKTRMVGQRILKAVERVKHDIPLSDWEKEEQAQEKKAEAALCPPKKAAPLPVTPVKRGSFSRRVLRATLPEGPRHPERGIVPPSRPAPACKPWRIPQTPCSARLEPHRRHSPVLQTAQSARRDGGSLEVTEKRWCAPRPSAEQLHSIRRQLRQLGREVGLQPPLEPVKSPQFPEKKKRRRPSRRRLRRRNLVRQLKPSSLDPKAERLAVVGSLGRRKTAWQRREETAEALEKLVQFRKGQRRKRV